MRVLFIIDTLQVGGAEKSLLEILRHTPEIESQVCQIYTGDDLRPAFDKCGILVHPLQIRKKYGYLTAIRRVISVIRQQSPDLIHTILARADIVGRFAGYLSGVPVISSFVNESYAPVRFEKVPLSLRFKFRSVQFLDRSSAGLVFHFVSNSEASKESNCDALQVDRDRVSVIYRGRDLQDFIRPDPSRLLQLRQELLLPDHTPTILNVGRLVPQKRQQDLLHAFNIVRKQCEARLLIAGEGPLRGSLQDLIHELKLGADVSLLGRRSDINDLLHLADVFVFPSGYEGHPGALIEAMISGIPAIASDIPVHRETLSDGVSGLLVPICQPEKIAEAILWMLNNNERARQMAQAAQSAARERFNIAGVAKRYAQLYQKVFEDWKSRK